MRLGLSLLLSIAIVPAITAQNPNSPGLSQPAKSSLSRTVTLSGTVADDGKTFNSEKDDAHWIIRNPEALKRHVGHHVIVKCRLQPGSPEIEILKVRMKPEVTSAARLGDSAFRR